MLRRAIYASAGFPWIRCGSSATQFLLTPFALAAAERKPNLVLLIARGWRGQAVPWARDPDFVATNLQKFANDGVVFPRTYSCYPRPAPARAALATGRYPHTTGVIKDDAKHPPAEATIDAVLKDAGYRLGQTSLGSATDFFEKNRDRPFFLTISLPGLSGAARDLAKHCVAWSALDAEIGRLIQALPDGTIVVFTSDCGEQIGAHDLEGDDVFFEESVRIPLAIRYPPVLPRGLASDHIVCQVDIMPTLLGLCGEAAPEGVQGRDVLKGERSESIYAEGRMGQSDEWRMLVLGADKLVVNAHSEVIHMYNLAEDPHELTNLARDGTVKLKRDGLLAQLRAAGRHFADFKRR